MSEPNALLPINPEIGDESDSQPEILRFGGEAIRDRLVEALTYEVLGPANDDEIIDQSPATRYLVGMLAPQGTELETTEDDSADTAADSEETNETPPPLNLSLNPSSIGISFVVPGDVQALEVMATWGEYSKERKAEEVDAEQAADIDLEEDPDETRKKKSRPVFEWKRTPHRASVTIDEFSEGRSKPVTVGEQVTVEWLVRNLKDRHEGRVISVFLVNSRTAPASRRPPDEMWIYQPKLSVTGTGAPFLARHAAKDVADIDMDVASADLIYRHRLEFATGHGVSTNWRLSKDVSGQADEIWTEMVPSRRVPIVRPLGTSVAPGALNMDELGKLDGSKALEVLGPLLAAYEDWIIERETEMQALPEPHRGTAETHLIQARTCLQRMRDGVDILAGNSAAAQAFRFANRAMALQRRTSVRVLEFRRGNPAPNSPDIPAEWRPFQLGFILQCLASIIDPSRKDRQIADLLWFPTGGGKTEAYLGLSAFVMAYRRIRPSFDDLEDSAGTSVLMRYTLRLLTIQQFQRATALLCACEVIRRSDESLWGSHRFTIGLWVGQSVTPNLYSQSKEALEKLIKGDQVYEKSPYQVLFCPWCGTDLEPHHYRADDDLERTNVGCPNRDCEFAPENSGEGLPVLLVDQEIYRHPPSMLLATVDKFAQMAWNGRVQTLFGRVERFCPRHGFLSAGEDHASTHAATKGWPKETVVPHGLLAPPELVIQDELHLISGPLGTLVGIYETAVEGLSRRSLNSQMIGPKVVASTATVRRAGQQLHSIFARRAAIFPPLGLDASDSFFAREDQTSPGRLYLGIYAPGKSIKTALVRVYAAMLLRAKAEFDAVDASDTKALEEADAYMTLVGYFNSLRELGGALRLVDDDVPARMRVLRKRGFGGKRFIYEPKELTSRAASSQITRTLKQLDRTFLDVKRGEYPIDILLASNMLSVGVDINRLGLMVVSAQPKTSAEYIQATSRVGRAFPGLIIEVYNWIRPRDTSHYERFNHYHDTFYRHVEATSVTPFSARARDRAFPGVLTSYIRQADPQYSQEKAADSLDPDSEIIKSIANDIVERARYVTEREDVVRAVELHLKNLLGEWHGLTGGDPALVYTGRGLSKEKRALTPVLLKSMERDGGAGIWEVSGSLREIEPEVDVVLLENEVNE